MEWVDSKRIQGKDNDGDGAGDARERRLLSTDPYAADSDGDGLTDYEELYVYFNHVSPFDADSDDDQLNDYAEIVTYGRYAASSLSAARNSDGDGLSDFLEATTYHCNPMLADTDGDGIHDKYEVDYGWSPTNSGNATQDDDSDGFNNLTEYQWCTIPNS